MSVSATSRPGSPGLGGGATLRKDRAGVADVVGSMLLVAITVVAATAFAFLLLSFDGPADQVHARLAVSVGPGADQAWGTGDEVIRVSHLGGEPVPQDGTVIVYRIGSGPSHSVVPTFADRTLRIGQTWTQVAAEPVAQGDAVRVRAAVAGGGSTQLLADATTVAGDVTPVPAFLRYVAAATATTGAVTGFAAAQAEGDGAAAALLEEAPSTPPTSSNLTATAHANAGAANPDRVLASDNQYAVLDGNAEWVQASGYAPPPGHAAVGQVVVGVEARGVPTASSTVAHQQTVTGTATSTASVVSGSVTGASGHVYVAAIANGDSSLRTVSGVAGLGLTWSKVAEAQASASTGRLEVWVGTGTAATGAVTASFTGGNVNRAAIAVSRYSGVDPANPVQASTAAEATGSGSSAVALAGIPGALGNGRFYAAVNAVERTGVTFVTPSPLGERADIDVNARVQLAVADGGASATNIASGTVDGGATDWQAVALTLRPLFNPMPAARISYLVNGVAGAATLVPALASSDSFFTLDVTSDRAWTVADVAQVAVRVEATAANGGTVQVDRAYLVTATSVAPITYAMAIEMAFASVPTGGAQVVQVQYRVDTPGDTFRLQVWDGSSWATSRTCAGTLASTSWALFSCSLVLPGEYQGGAPRIRFVDATPAGTTQGKLRIDYARVATL